MKFNFFILLFVVFMLSCEGLTDDQSTPQPPSDENLAPGDFSVKVDSVSYNKAYLSWEKSIDPEGFKVFYSIRLGDSLVIKDIRENYAILENLEGSKNYKGIVISEDPQGNSVSADFEFTTKKDYQTFLKYLNFHMDRECISGFIQHLFETPDGNFLAVGKTSENGSNFFNYVAKIDPLGNPIWMKTYPYENGNVWEIRANLTESGLIIVSNHYVINLDHEGNEIWVKYMERFNIGVEGVEIKDIVQSANGEFYLIGDYNSDNPDIFQPGIIMKLSPSGEVLWEKFFEGSISRIITGKENDLWIIGSKEVNGCTQEESNSGYCDQIDFWLVRLNLNGEILWEKTYGDTNHDLPYYLIQLDNGNLVFGGTSIGPSQTYAARILEVDQSGELIFDHVDEHSYFFSIRETPDRGLITVGMESAYAYQRKLGLVKFDANRSKEWSKSYGDYTTSIYGYDLLVDQEGFRIAASRQNMIAFDCDEKLLFIKTDPWGYFEIPSPTD
ncbi:fibronectin type III domain-containing protein [Algoriphagus confluentis]